MPRPRRTENGQIIPRPEPPPPMENANPIQVRADNELQITSSGAYALQEIQGSMILAKKFPRNIDDVWARTMKACQRRSMAESATYAYPRGGTTITGPSVNLARVIAGIYGNIRFGIDVLRDDKESRLIRGWCWDVESNTKVHFDDDFRKLIYRKVGGWVEPDERDLRELTMRRGAILVRNAIFNIVPRDLTEDALYTIRETLKSSIKDPDGEKKRLILEFGKIGVTVPQITQYMGTSSWGQEEILELRGILTSIQDGASKKDEYFFTRPEPTKEVIPDTTNKTTGEITEKKVEPQATVETPTPTKTGSLLPDGNGEFYEEERKF